MVTSTEGPPRKVYRTTREGRQALEEGMGLLGELVQGLGMVLGEDWLKADG
jgi:DNA-binding PadR family transcriptional regulator